MTNNRSETARFLVYNQGVSTSSPVNDASRSSVVKTGFQPFVGQQTGQTQSSVVIRQY